MDSTQLNIIVTLKNIVFAYKEHVLYTIYTIYLQYSETAGWASALYKSPL